MSGIEIEPFGTADLTINSLLGTATLALAAAPVIEGTGDSLAFTLGPVPVIELQAASEPIRITLSPLTPVVDLTIAAGPPGSSAWEGHEPVFTWSGSQLTAIAYNDGTTKGLTYNPDGTLLRIDHVRPGGTLRKTFTWTGGGLLQSIDETVLP